MNLVCVQAGDGAASVSEISSQRGTAGAGTTAGRQTDGTHTTQGIYAHTHAYSLTHTTGRLKG